MRIRILLAGNNGQVGWELERSLQALGQVIALGRKGLDLGDLTTLQAKLNELRPDLIVNAAAYTAVDRAESEPELAYRVNAEAPRLMADWAKQHNAAFVHFSTDYVYDGMLDRPYLETDQTAPLSAYGRSKLAGDELVVDAGCAYLILRTSWVYGGRGRNFLKTILRLSSEGDELRIVNDQFGAPTWSRSVAEATACLLAAAANGGKGDISAALRTRGGVFHLTNSGSTSWHGFVEAILQHVDPKNRIRLTAIKTSDYPTPAHRPRNSRLSGAKLETVWGIRLPQWNDALALCLAGMSLDC